jgi:hypothetical protein
MRIITYLETLSLEPGLHFYESLLLDSVNGILEIMHLTLQYYIGKEFKIVKEIMLITLFAETRREQPWKEERNEWE